MIFFDKILQLKFWTVIVSLLLATSSCDGPDSNSYKLLSLKNTTKPTHTILFVGFGGPDSITNVNKGYGVDYYAYFDLNKDSVYVWWRKELGTSERLAGFGKIKHLVSKDTLADFIRINGNLKSDTIEIINPQSCGRYYFVEYNVGSVKRTFFSNTHYTDIELVRQYVFSLFNSKQIRFINPKFNEDSLMNNLITYYKFPAAKIIAPPAPPIISIGEFISPIKELSK